MVRPKRRYTPLSSTAAVAGLPTSDHHRLCRQLNHSEPTDHANPGIWALAAGPAAGYNQP
jgi:hypothetical protein